MGTNRTKPRGTIGASVDRHVADADAAVGPRCQPRCFVVNVVVNHHQGGKFHVHPSHATQHHVHPSTNTCVEFPHPRGKDGRRLARCKEEVSTTRLVDRKRPSDVPNWHGENVEDEQDPSFGSKHHMRSILWSSTHPRAPNFHGTHFASRSSNSTPHEEQLILLECTTDGHETNVME